MTSLPGHNVTPDLFRDGVGLHGIFCRTHAPLKNSLLFCAVVVIFSEQKGK